MISDIKKYLYYLLWILIIKCFEKGLAHVRRAASSQVPSTHLSKGNNKDIARGAPALKKQAHSFSQRAPERTPAPSQHEGTDRLIMRSVRQGRKSQLEQGSRKMARMLSSQDKQTPDTSICNGHGQVATAFHHSP